MTKKTRKDIRFALIDHYLTWYGQLQAHEIGEVLKIERPNAQALIKQYQEQRRPKGKDTIKGMGNGRNQHQATHHQVKLQMQKSF